jgi:cytochrome P450
VAPNHSFLFGHLLYLKAVLDKLPRDSHYNDAFAEIYREQFQKEGVFYLDFWPVSGVIIAVFSPTAATAVLQTHYETATSRPDLLPRWFKPITGGASIFDMAEPEWRPWRAVFSKGFNNEHFVSHLPGMIEETKIYAETLRNLARKGEMFYLDLVTLRFMMDMIGKTLLFDLSAFVDD